MCHTGYFFALDSLLRVCWGQLAFRRVQTKINKMHNHPSVPNSIPTKNGCSDIVATRNYVIMLDINSVDDVADMRRLLPLNNRVNL